MNLNEPENRINDFEFNPGSTKSGKNAPTIQYEMSFRQAIENSIPSGISVIDETGRQVSVNQSFCKLVGWDESELLDKHPPFVYWALQDIENLKNALNQTLNFNAPKEGFDLLFCHKNGKLIPVNVIISSFKQGDNNTFYLANVIDITERRKTEEALMQSQLLLRSSIESQKNTIIFSIDRNYQYLVFNKAHWNAMKFAYNKDIKIGINVLDCITNKDDKELLKENFDRAFRGESPSIIQTFGDINLAYYEVFFNPILDEKHKIIGCTGLARNIAELKLAEQELKNSEITYKEIINQIKDAIIVFDEEGKIKIWNRGAEQIYGLKADDFLNKSIIDIQYQFAPPPSNDKGLIEKVLSGIITQQTPEVFNKIQDSEIIALDSGKIRNIQSMVFPIKLKENHLFCFVIRDTTEIKRYEKELLRLSAEKDKFYSIIAQNLYTPFNLFNNFSKLMAEELDNLPIKEIQKMAVMMSKSASNLYSLLDNLLQWTRLNQGKIPFEPQKLNFKIISQEALSILKSHADAKNIKINNFVTDDINVFADNFMLKTILRNLVSNAIKFISSDGQINIYAQETTSDLIISVSETGTGMAPDYLTKLFDISQINLTSGSAEEKGTALGLLLSKEFVEKHGGKIWLENDSSNGNEIKFTLPEFS